VANVPRTAELDAYLVERATGTHTLTVTNVGKVPVERVEWTFPSDASRWQLLEGSVVPYPIPLLEPGEAQTALVLVREGGPATVDVILRGWVEGVEYTWQRTLSLAASSPNSYSQHQTSDSSRGTRSPSETPSASRFGWMIDLGWSGWIIRLGEVAVALAAIAGVITGFVYWVLPSNERGSADVSIEGISPRTYGGWLRDEHIEPTGFTKRELDAPGVKVTYMLTTAVFDRNTELPVYVVLTDLKGQTLKVIEDPFTLDHKGDGCDGCSDWLRLDPQHGTVFVGISVYRPGVAEEPIANDEKTYCPQTTALKSCD